MSELRRKTKIGVGVITVLVLVFWFFLDIASGGELTFTTYLGEKAQRGVAITSIVRKGVEKTSDALFDIVLTIPEKSQQISSGEDLLMSIELINFGTEDKTDVSISYIITSEEGDIILIEHESLTVGVQYQFIKEIDLPELRYGKYKILIEMLYSDTSAIATGEFLSLGNLR